MKNRKFDDMDSPDSDKPVFDDRAHESSKPMRRLHPLGLRVVAKIVKEANVTDGGLYLPEGAKEAT